MHTHTMSIVSFVIICVLSVSVAGQSEQLLLRDGWHIQSAAKVAAPGEAIAAVNCAAEGWHPARIPTTVLAALVDDGVYPDPYYGLNLKSIPGYQDGAWLVMKKDSPFRDPWWYRTEFDAPAAWKGRHITLHLDGINYKANIWLNGAMVADSESVQGMFRRFEFPVTELLSYGGRNALAVEIIPPGLLPEKNYRTKQIEATTGWDDHNPQPPDGNMGIWRDVYLRATGPIAIRHPYVATELNVPALDTARLTVSAFLRNNTADAVTGTLSGKISDVTFSQEIRLDPGETREIFFTPEEYPQLVFRNPRVWWPHPHGPQALYDLDFSVAVEGPVSDTAHTRFGIRDITTFMNDEDWRVYMVNGRHILIRGGAWMTNDMMLRLCRPRYEAMVRYAREAHLNMLRSEGFSIRETEDFYDLCDEYGIMVTQQIFGRSIPDEALAVACIEDMMLRIRNHPSLAHFLGHDETFPTDTLDKAYRDLIEKHRVRRTYQPHSGTFFVGTRKETGGTRTGTRELWTYAGPSHYYLRKDDGAWGFAQSGGIGGIVAPLDSIRQMMPEDQLWPALGTEAWSFHSVIQGADYFDAFHREMKAGYGAPTDLEDFCRKAYAMNYNSARGMYEAYGRNKYDASGLTTWKYNAAWPAAITWQYVDWYLRATAAYYGAKKACTPVHAQYAYDDECVYVVNGRYQPMSGLQVSATVYDFSLKIRHEQRATVDVDADGVAKAFAIPKIDDLSKTYFLKLTLADAEGAPLSDNFYWLSTSRDIPGISGHSLKGLFYVKPQSRADFTALSALPPAAVDMTYDATPGEMEWRITATLENTGPHLAFMLQLAAVPEGGGPEIGPAYWSENCFSLLPGESRSVTAIIPTDALPAGAPTVRLTGWNLR